MTLGLIPRNLSSLLLHQMVLLVQSLEPLVISGVDGVVLFIFLLNILNSITILPVNNHFLILLMKESVVFIILNFLLLRNLKTFEGNLQLSRIEAESPQSLLLRHDLAVLGLICTAKRRGHRRRIELLIF